MNRQLSMATRAFLLAFIPAGLTLVASFAIINKAVEGRIKDRLRDSLQRAVAARSKSDTENRQRIVKALSALSENPTLKAVIGLSREAQDAAAATEATETLAMQLRQIGAQVDFDLLLLEDTEGQSVAAVGGKDRTAFNTGGGRLQFLGPSLLKVQDVFYETVSIPVNLGEENLGSLVLGRAFDIHHWDGGGPAVLFSNDTVIASTLPKAGADGAIRDWRERCGMAAVKECDVRIGAETYLASAVSEDTFGDGLRMVHFQSIDAAAGDFTRGVRDVFPWIGGCAVLVAFLVSLASSRSIARPLVNLIAQLKKDEKDGALPSGAPRFYPAVEVSQLAIEISKVAGAARDSARRLDEATEQFIASMAQALDARDPNTAGHSYRVSVNAAEVARAMGLSRDEVEIVRIGAQLHDIGKIGIPDNVLMKPGRLTREEYQLIQRHPQIGKEILEKTRHFSDYLPIVELHHENMDGTGYPYGLTSEKIPLGVRIVHVVDVHDAITCDRVYRKAMTDEQAWDLLWGGAGKQFDRKVVEIYWEILSSRSRGKDAA